MDRTIKTGILAALLVWMPLAVSLAEPAPPPGTQPSAVDINTAVNSTPQVAFPQTKFEFDSVFEGTEVKHDFVVENKGDAPLIINKIRPD
jgi:hypothetical protein